MRVLLTRSQRQTFQSTPPRGRRLNRGGAVTEVYDFNPRLREGGDFGGIYDLIQFYAISIHASAREATSDNVYTLMVKLNFNPRLREGGDANDNNSTN